ncbi:(4Fe-4S)-binding protein [Methanocella sp. CWC-04]|uniref:(4Fe-4S)-binding protein n=1 Tax=Methanooceanicella nereidis TaxID=2052831 RepID=A0AAP2RDQ6_9EURY|nr:ATP-binding protein [Methanocella sp. CWC-04]MCD1294317.1 (4Fe-4S)-binding protein [Methanocella sp. CWC-04]
MTFQITVVSGKGGTGKTTLTASLAYLLKDIVVADCDVDASNLHLLLDPVVKEKKPYYGHKISAVDEELCTGCGLCETNCRFGAIKVDEGLKAHIDSIACEACGVCSFVCPAGAIKLEDRPTGEVYISDTDVCPMVHARLNAGEGTAGKLVTMVREEACKIAGKDGMVLIDGPPGIGCPVIASVAGTNIAVIVIEPTVSGVNDFNRVLSVVNRFKVKPCVCINKYDLNLHYTECVEGYCKEAGIRVLGRVPYDREVYDSICDGIVPVKGVRDEIKAYYVNIFENLKRLIDEIRSENK